MTSEPINWEGVHRRIGGMQRALDRPAQASREILEERARMLAEKPQTKQAEEQFEFVEFLLGGERYGIEASYVREIFLLRDFTELPGVPPFLLGIINVRGRIISVVDLKKVFELPDKGVTELNKAIVLSGHNMEFGLLADEVPGTRSVPLAGIRPCLSTLTDARERYLRGLTPDAVVILDAEKLLSDKTLIVEDEVEV